MGKDIGTDRRRHSSPLRGSTEGYLLHQVSKLDTLAGVAIKYGVEVSDIKRANGLVSDYQMFAHKTIMIPVCENHSSPTSMTELDNFSSAPPIKAAAHFCPAVELTRDAVGVKRHVLSAMICADGTDGMSSSSAQHTHYAHHLGKHSDVESFHPLTTCTPYANNGVRANPRGAKAHTKLGITSNNVKDVVILSTDMADGSKANKKSVRRRSKVDAENALFGPHEAKYHKQETGILDGMLPSILFPSSTEKSDGMFVSILKLLDGTLFGGKGRANTACSTFNSLEHKISHVSTGGYNPDGGFVNQVSVSNFARPLFEGISKPVHDKAARD